MLYNVCVEERHNKSGHLRIEYPATVTAYSEQSAGEKFIKRVADSALDGVRKVSGVAVVLDGLNSYCTVMYQDGSQVDTKIYEVRKCDRIRL